MVRVAFAVIAHEARREAAEALATLCGSGRVEIFMDDGSLGERVNHGRAWAWGAAQDADWLVQVEDDAVPVPGFPQHVAQGLEHVPSWLKAMVTFYAGADSRERLARDYQTALVKAEETGAAWVRMRRPHWGVCMAAPVGLCSGIAQMVNTGRWPGDNAVGHWTIENQVSVFSSVPSLVDHDDDTPSLVGNGVGVARRAYRVGVPDWNSAASVMR